MPEIEMFALALCLYQMRRLSVGMFPKLPSPNLMLIASLPRVTTSKISRSSLSTLLKMTFFPAIADTCFHSLITRP